MAQDHCLVSLPHLI